MKKYLIMSLLCLLPGCASNGNSGNEPGSATQVDYIDLSAPDSQAIVAKYWTLVKRFYPRYPINAAKERLSGCVSLVFVINSDGQPVIESITDSFPKGVFDASAEDTLRLWRWNPASTNQQRTPVLSTVQLDFMIQHTKNKSAAEQHCNFDIQKITSAGQS